MRSSFRSVSLIGIIVLLAAAFGGITPAKAETTVFINEIHYDNSGTDAGEAVEIAGPAGTDLTGWSIALYNGSASQLNVYNTIGLSGLIPDQQGGYGTIAFNQAGIQNGAPDGLALVDDGNNVVQFLSYEGSFTAVDGPAAGQTSTDIGVAEGSSTTVGYSLQLAGVGTTYDDFAWALAAASTFDAINNDQTFGSPSEPFINEIHYDNTGGDSGEAVEVAGPAGTDLAGWSLILYNGSSSQLKVYDTIAMSGLILDQEGGYGTLSFSTPGIQNGSPDGLALVDSGDHVIQFLSYEGSFTAVDGPAAGQTSTDIGVAEGSSTTVGYSLQLAGVGTTYDDFAWALAAASTFDAINNDQTFGSHPPVLLTPIYDIQYTTDPSGDSPLKNQSGVTTEGIVTAVFSNGYFIENPAGGPWNGLWVYDSNTPSIGDFLHLTGKVVEYNGLTELKDLTGYVVVSTGNSGPDPVGVASGDVSQEQWEGVLVKVTGATVAHPNLGYGEWSVNDGSGDVVIDDKGSYSYAPNNGDSLAYVIGVLDYGYGAFKIQPRDDDDIKLSLCGYPATLIHDVQGNGSVSPLNGTSDVVIEGVVVGDFQTSSNLRGFFLQEEDADADADPLTSEGIFVYDGSTPAVDVNVDDVVRVTGEVTEYYGLTELTFITDIEVCGVGSTAAATVNLPVSSLDVWEQNEGMLIHIPQTLYATDNYNQGRYGEVTLSVGGRLDNPTNVVAPGAPAIAMQAQNDLSRIQLEDGRTAQNPDPAPYIGVDNTLRAGDMVPGVTGVLNYAFETYEIHPIGPVNFTRVNARDASPPSVGGSFKVASFNVLNYFITLDGSGPICGPTGGMDCRGADTAAEFTRQRDKIISAIVTMDADVIGLMEIENHATDAALQDLVDGLNAAAGAGTYDYISTGTVGTDAIKVAFVYKPGSVTPTGSFETLDSADDPLFIDTRNRPALAQTFTHTTGEVFTAVVNHLKSKGSDCNSIGDPDIGDGQGNCNLTRTDAAIALVNWLATDPTGSGDPDFLIIGDLNAYAQEDPVTAIKDGGYSNLIESFSGVGAYSYVYFGQAGYLDHALATPNLTSRVEGTAVWHINADEPSALDYNDYNQGYLYDPGPYRASDHDPVIVGICESVPPELSAEVTPDELWPANHKYVTVTATVDVFDASGFTTLTLVSVTSNEPDDGLGDGDTADDIVIIDDFTFDLRAERAGTGDGRVYTITYEATDACGNTTVVSVEVTVPFSKAKGK